MKSKRLGTSLLKGALGVLALTGAIYLMSTSPLLVFANPDTQDTPQEHLKMPHYFDAISTQWGLYNDTEGGNQNEVTPRETVNIDAQLTDGDTAVQWTVTFNAGKGIWNHPKMALAFPNSLELPEEFDFTHNPKNGSEPTNTHFTFAEWVSNRETDGKIFTDEDKGALAGALNYYFRGERNAKTEILDDDQTMIKPAPTKAELENISALVEFQGYGGYKRGDSYTIKFKTKLKDPSYTNATLFAGLKSREGEGVLNAGRRYYYRYEQLTINRMEMPEVVYCLNHKYANPPLKGFGNEPLEFGRTDYIDDRVPNPAYNGGNKELVEWLLYLGYPYDGANLLSELADDYRHVTTDATYAEWGEIGALNDYYGATQNAVWYFTDGTALTPIDHTYWVGNDKHELVRPIAQKLVDKAREMYATYGSLTNYLQKSGVPEADAYKAFYFQNNGIRHEEVTEKPYQNFIGLRKANSEETHELTGALTINKTDKDHQPLEGAQFDLYEGMYTTNEEALASGTNPVQKGLTSNSKGTFDLTSLKSNTPYTLVETKAPAGKEVGDPTIFRIERIYNIYADAGFDKQGWASFLHRAEEGSTSYRLALNKVALSGSEKGYRRWEPYKNNSFVLEGNEIKGTESIEIQNFNQIAIDITKVIQGTQTPLEGAQLKLVEGNADSTKVIAEWTSGKEPQNIGIAANKTYTLVETSAPRGFELAKPMSFTAVPQEDGTIDYWLLDAAMNRVSLNPYGSHFKLEDRRTGERVVKTTLRYGSQEANPNEPIKLSMYYQVVDKENHTWAPERSDSIDLVDLVDYFGLTPGETYELVSSVVEVKDDNTFGDVIFTTKQDITPESADGTVVVNLDQVAPRDSKRYTVTETFTSKKKIDGEIQVASHAASTANEQSFVVLAKDGTEFVSPSGNATIRTVAGMGTKQSTSSDAVAVYPQYVGSDKLTDTIEYTGLVAGEKYHITASLNAVHPDGSTTQVYEMKDTFTPEASAGTYTVTFEDQANAKKLADILTEHEGTRLVIFEKVESDREILGSNSKIKQVLTHTEPNSMSQSIMVEKTPLLSTTVDVAGHKASDKSPVVVYPDQATKVVDHVVYENFIGGSTYAAQGELHKVVNGKDAGVVARATTTFVADESGNGSFDVDFGDLSEVVKPGETYVVFEKAARVKYAYLTDGADGLGKVYEFNESRTVSHENLEDKAQTVMVVDASPLEGVLKTTVSANGKASDKDSIAEVEASDQGIEVVDTVDYKGLTIGQSYKLTATLMHIKDDGSAEPAQLTEGSNSVTHEFTPESGDGTEAVSFGVVKGLQKGHKYVVFETAESLNPVAGIDGQLHIQVIKHADPQDKAQTFAVASDKDETPEKPGENTDNPGGSENPGGDSDKPGNGDNSDKPGDGSDKPSDGGSDTPGGNTDPSKPSDGKDEHPGESGGSDKPGNGGSDNPDNKPGKDVSALPETPFVPTTPGVQGDATISTIASADGHKASDSAPAVAEIKAKDGVALVDTISYTGLVPGVRYEVTGRIAHVYEDGSIKIVDLPNTQNGEVSMTFTPESAEGTIQLDFGTVVGLQEGQKYVIFERVVSEEEVILSETEIAIQTLVHENPQDTAQTFKLSFVADDTTGNNPGGTGNTDDPGNKPGDGGSDKPGNSGEEKPGDGTKPGEDGSTGGSDKPGDGSTSEGGSSKPGDKPGNEGNSDKPGDGSDKPSDGNKPGEGGSDKPGNGDGSDKPGKDSSDNPSDGKNPSDSNKPHDGGDNDGSKDGNRPSVPGSQNDSSHDGHGNHGGSRHTGGSVGRVTPQTGDVAFAAPLLMSMAGAAALVASKKQR